MARAKATATMVSGMVQRHQCSGQRLQQRGWGATKRALVMEMQLQQQRGWPASKRAMTRAARVMAMMTATKRVMATHSSNAGNKEGNREGKEGGV